MSNEKLFIPKKCKVGFNYREETYSKKLAYVIYYDAKGKLRKEHSWSNWVETKAILIERNEEVKKDIERGENPEYIEELVPQEVINTFDPFDFDNEPTTGFVLNKGVGGQRESYGWNARNEYIRVWDPRGFEIEISVKNLLFILQETSATKGKGLEGEFVYAWDGKDLVLLPTSSLDYRESVKYTNLQDCKVTKKDMVPGCIYTHKNTNRLVYLGRYDYANIDYNIKHYSYDREYVKKHIFYNLDNGKYIQQPGFTNLAIKETDEPVDIFSELLEGYFNTKHGGVATELVFKSMKKPVSISYDYYDYHTYKYLKIDGEFVHITVESHTKYNQEEHKDEMLGYYILKHHKPILNGFDTKCDTNTGQEYSYWYNEKIHGKLYTKEEIENLDFHNCFVKLKSGKLLLFDEYSD